MRCVSTGGDKSTNLPQLVFLDRVPWVIDIAGFTRITENSIEDVIRLSGLSIKHWIAKKGGQHPDPERASGSIFYIF